MLVFFISQLPRRMSLETATHGLTTDMVTELNRQKRMFEIKAASRIKEAYYHGEAIYNNLPNIGSCF